MRMKVRNITIVFVVIGAATVVAFGLVTMVDMLAGRYLTSRNYFTLMHPRVTEIYDTSEFSVTATISAQGLRNPLVAGEKTKGKPRVLALGDSFTFGWGVDEEAAWPKALEHIVSEKGTPIEVINAGAPGMSLDTEVFACDVYKTWFHPDVIVLGVYLTDDLYQLAAEDIAANPLQKFLQRRFPILTHVGSPTLMYSWHESREGTYISSHDWRRRAGANIGLFPDFAKLLDPDVRDIYLTGKLNPSVISFASHAPNYLVALLDAQSRAQALSIYAKYFTSFARDCAGNTPLVVVLIPGDELVSSYFHPFRKAEGYLVDSTLTTLDLDTPLRAIMEPRGTHVVSLVDVFRHKDCTTCYYPWDMHLTVLGQQQVAEAVAPEIIKLIERKQ